MFQALRVVQKYLVYLVIFLLPLVVTSTFANAFTVGKLALLAFGVVLALLVWAVNLAFSGRAQWGTGKFDIAVLLLILSYVVSAALATPNKMEAFLLPGGATVVIAAGMLYFLVNQLDEKGQKMLSGIIFYSAVVFSLISLLATTGSLNSIPQLPAFVKLTTFNTLGGHLPAALFLGVSLLLGIGVILKEKEVAKKLLTGVSLVLVLLGLGVSVRESLPERPTAPRLASFDTSWNVAVDTLQISPLLGVGPGNYLTSFNRFRPLEYNQGDLWNLRFTAARDFYLTFITEAGLLGAFALVVLFLAIWRATRSRGWKNSGDTMSFLALLTLVLLIAVFPAAPYLVVLLFILLALNSSAKIREIDLGGGNKSRVPGVIVSIPLIAAIIVFLYFGVRGLAAEARFKSALDSLSANDGRATYDTLRQAINLNPYVDRYHATYSQVNLALAQNIAQTATAAGNVTDEDRSTIATLIQQAIREAKAVASLNIARSGNWEMLARTYQSIIAFAQGADTFAIESYNQAIALDPINPNLRIALGGLYYALGNYDEAIKVFQLAVIAKPDLANAHYNLAIAYREKGDTESAISEMTNVLALTDKSSADYQLATEVMNALEEKRATETADTENLTTPEDAEQVLRPPLDLPENSEPPSSQ